MKIKTEHIVAYLILVTGLTLFLVVKKEFQEPDSKPKLPHIETLIIAKKYQNQIGKLKAENELLTIKIKQDEDSTKQIIDYYQNLVIDPDRKTLDSLRAVLNPK
ncbi:MAG: hypothetical protein R3279_05385 [Putridiphycobacter sp.]|nr:hypothetical protein [Putridiphycobacter sp.]